MPVVGQDDNFFLTDTGGRIAKSALSSSKRKEYEDLLSSPTSMPIAEPVMTIPNREKYANAISNVRGFLRDITNRPEDTAQATAPQMTPAPMMPAPMPMPPAPVMPGPQTIQEAGINPSIFEQPSAGRITSANQIGMQQSPPQASLAGVTDLTPYNQPVIDDKAMKAFETGLNLQQSALRKQAEITRKQNLETEKVMLDNDRMQTQIDFDLMRKQEAQVEAVNNATKSLADAEKTYLDYKVNPDRFFEGQPGKRLLAGLAIAFGSIGQALTGQKENAALSIINKAIDDDIDAQKSARDQLGAAVTQKQKAIDVIKANFKDERDFQIAQKNASIGMAQREIQRIATRYGTPEAEAKAQVLIGQLEMKRGELLDEMNQRALRRADAEWAAQAKAQEVKNTKFTEGQYKAAGFAERMQQAESNFEELEKQGFNRASRATAFWEAIKPESEESEQYKLQKQAENNFVSAVLRKESGAVIGDVERENEARKYFPRAGDTPKVLAQKKESRRLAMEGMFREAKGLVQADTSKQDAAVQRSQFDMNRTQTGAR